MVVSLLALLFVVVTGFLNVARSNRAMVVDAGQTDLIDAVVDDMDDWAISLIKEQIVDSAGKVLPGGSGDSYSFEDIAGYRHSNYLAALEPIWDPAPYIPAPLDSGSWAVLGQICWPAVTSLDDAVAQPAAFPLFRLILDYDFDDSAVRRPDVQWNARKPFMDADGDGVPDSSFLLCAPATEAANTMAGTSVRLPRYDPADPTGAGGAFVPFRIPQPIFAVPGYGDSPLRGHMWMRYAEHARYEVAMRIISHGGMVTLDSPTLYDGTTAYSPFNREFTINLFDATLNAGDVPMRNQYSAAQEHGLFDELHANAGAIEPALRRRFLLPGPPQDDQGRRSVPSILAELQGELGGGFPYTLLPRFSGEPESTAWLNNWQRLNIGVAPNGDQDERAYWARAVSLSATDFNTNGLTGWIVDYDRRHATTTINNSDDLARKQVRNDPVPSAMNGAVDLESTGNRGSTFEGELKFYLGEIGKAFDRNLPGTGQYQYNHIRGSVIVQRLARLYFDMLGSHSKPTATSTDEWDNATNDLPTAADGNQAVSRRQQAFMLAVNTLAFAAPRDLATSATPGWIDPVTYSDDPMYTPQDPSDDVVYIGYAPQPFFTEAIAFNEARDESSDPAQISIAVEIYNPNDPYDDGTGTGWDVFGLYLPQFAVSVEEVNGSMVAWPLTGCGPIGTNPNHLPGRTFTSFVIKPDNANSHFDSTVHGPAIPVQNSTGTLLSLDTSKDDITIKLLRQRRSDGGWFVVERIQVGMPVQQPSDDNDEWKSVYRDTSTQRDFATTLPIFGGDADVTLPFARWNVATNIVRTAGAHADGSAGLTTLNNAKALMGTGVEFDPDLVLDPFSPGAPLFTMNAAPDNYLPMFNDASDLRPPSFPTVGFMLFIPRFSHMRAPETETPVTGAIPMSYTLLKQWDHHSYLPMPGIGYPADFGHMPIFDNTQAVVGGTYLDTVGDLPWGLLVFDYFTTIDPTRDVNGPNGDDPDVDPLRIPGRININTAPWYVLSKLPMLGPQSASGNILPIVPPGATVTAEFPSPSFWDPFVGMLVGAGGWSGAAYTTHRQLLTEVIGGTYSLDGRDMPYLDTSDPDGRYRLGAWLAQSAAAYRDGVQYVRFNNVDPFGVYAGSHLRNGAGQYLDATGNLVPNVSPGLIPPYRLENLPGMTTPLYGLIRGRLLADPDLTQPDRPDQFGFVTLGELLNVKGFDSSRDDQLPPFASDTDGNPITPDLTTLFRGDFVRAVSLLALLDSQYLTTRSNTFTVYTSVMDRKDPQASLRSQVTVDRSNLLPRLTYAYSYFDTAHGEPRACNPDYPLDPAVSDYPLAPLLLNLDTADLIRETPVRTTNEDAMPQIIAREHVGYFNARYDD